MPSDHLLVEKRWSSHPSNVHAAREVLRQALRFLVDSTEIDLLELAIGEACANAVEHGSPCGEQSHFTLRCSVQRAADLIVEVEDEGREFALTDLTLSRMPDIYSEGGRGLFLINRIMDQVTLLRTDHGLTVRMAKHVAGLAGAGAQPPACDAACR